MNNAHKTWRVEEIEYLSEHWGNRSVKAIAKHLGRSETAVCVKSVKLGLGRFLDNGDRYVTKHTLFSALGMGSDSYKNISWIKNRGLKTHKIERSKQTFEVIYLDEFWKWAFKNQSFIDFSRFERYALGPEPDWVQEKRKNDARRYYEYIKTPWSQGEDLRLKRLLKEKKYGFKELSKILHRTEGAIQRRISELKIKDKPIKADTHIKWFDEEFLQLGEMIKRGYTYEQMSDVLGKSSKAIRGRVFDKYFTERLDMVRSYIGGGKFGDGTPELKLRYLRKLPADERSVVKEDLSILAGVLRAYAKKQSGVSEEFQDYWQKDMCQHWDDVLGCTANETDCDTCTSFLRIKVQHCKRCGKDFFERKENDFCKPCRDARIKQLKKKWAILKRKQDR